MEANKKPTPPWVVGLDPVADLLEEVEQVRGLSLAELGERVALACWASAQIWAARGPGAGPPPQEPRSAQALRDWRAIMERSGERRE